jgi:hypothetical protein
MGVDLYMFRGYTGWATWGFNRWNYCEHHYVFRHDTDLGLGMWLFQNRVGGKLWVFICRNICDNYIALRL